MGRTVLFAVIASSPLVLGAYLGSRFRFPERLLAAVLAFAAGALITALTFELFEESYEKGGAVRAAVGLAVGAIVFTAASVFLDRYVATAMRRRIRTTPTAAPSWTRTPRRAGAARPRRR
jgi:ZIP family zinc transporter